MIRWIRRNFYRYMAEKHMNQARGRDREWDALQCEEESVYHQSRIVYWLNKAGELE